MENNTQDKMDWREKESFRIQNDDIVKYWMKFSKMKEEKTTNQDGLSKMKSNDLLLFSIFAKKFLLNFQLHKILQSDGNHK